MCDNLIVMTGKPRLLNVDRISEAAFDLLDEQGLEAFSLRHLASRLNVHASALYRHFDSKDALLLHLTKAMLANSTIAMPKTLDANWQDWIAYDAHRLRANLLTHRDGPQLCMTYHQQVTSPHSTALFKALNLNGFTKHDASYCVSTVVNYVIGFALEESYKQKASQTESTDLEFEYGLKILIEGIKSIASITNENRNNQLYLPKS